MILNLRACRGSLQHNCFRSFAWWNECTYSAITKIRPKGSPFFLTIPFKREYYCQWSLAYKSGSYQKCHKAAWGLCNFLQVEGTQTSQWWAAFCKSNDQQTDRQNHLCKASPHVTELLTSKLNTLTWRPNLPFLPITMKPSCTTVSDVWYSISSPILQGLKWLNRFSLYVQRHFLWLYLVLERVWKSDITTRMRKYLSSDYKHMMMM